MLKNILNKIINTICIVIIVLAILVLGLVCMSRFTGENNVLGFSAFRVMTESMVPVIPVDSFVLVKKTVPEDVKEGDIISFYSNDPQLGGAVNTHRVTELELAESGKLLSFKTKGDNNVVADNYAVYPGDLIGRVVFISHALGVAVRLLSNPLVFIPIILIPLLVIFISNIRTAVKAVKELSAEEEDEIKRIIKQKNSSEDDK